MIKKTINTDRSQRRFVDLVGVDFATTATKVVRLKKSRNKLSVAGIEILPAVELGVAASTFQLPKSVMAHYGCLAYTGDAAIMRVINTQLSEGENQVPEAKMRKLLNVSDDFRVSSRLIKRGEGRKDSAFLAAAIPSDEVQFFLNMFPAGPPAPASLEISGLSFVSAFLHGYGAECEDSIVCLLETGESGSQFVFLTQGEVSLAGKMSFGAKTLRTKLSADLGVDDELAGSILNDRSINISSSLASVMDPFIKQLSISKDFIERNQGRRVSKVYVSGGLSLLPAWMEELGTMLHIEVAQWNPFKNIECNPGLLTPEITKQATRFSAAVGAAIGGFEA